MVAPRDVSGVMVTLHIEDEQKLFVMLAADGMIKRMGTGTVECKENELFIGKAGTKAFERVRSLFGAILDNWLGSYASPGPGVHKGDAAQFGSSLVGIELRPLSIRPTDESHREERFGHRH